MEVERGKARAGDASRTACGVCDLCTKEGALGRLLCAGDFETALSRSYAVLDMWHQVYACSSGRCMEVAEHFTVPLVRKLGIGLSGFLACLNAEHTLHNASLVIPLGTGEPGVFWSNVIDSFFFSDEFYPQRFQTAPPSERASMLRLLVARGMDLVHLGGSRTRLRKPAVECAKEHRTRVTDAVAAHLPVEGVPEIVSAYTGTPYDILLCTVFRVDGTGGYTLV